MPQEDSVRRRSAPEGRRSRANATTAADRHSAAAGSPAPAAATARRGLGIWLIGLSIAVICGLGAWRIAAQRGGADDSVNGGWRLATEEELRRIGSDVCSVDRLSISQVTPQLFDRVYRYRRPLIITFPNGAGQWCDTEQWTAGSIRRVYGDWNITTGKAVELVYSGGKPDSVDTFGRFMDEMKSRPPSADPWYLFDRTFYPTSNLPSSIRLPTFLFTNEDSIFFLGSTGTGATFHKHMPAWNGVVFGQKRWFLYPADRSPPGGLHGYNSASWLRNVYPHLTDADKPIECIQQAGEIFYVPESYYHAVLNIGDTIAVSLQLRTTVTELETTFYKATNTAYRAGAVDENDGSEAKEYRQQLAKEALQIYTNLHLSLPNNTEIVYEIASLYHSLEEEERAKKLYERVIEMDRFYVKAYLALAYLYEDRMLEGDQERMYKLALQANPDSKEVWREYATLLLRQERYSEANDAYSKHLSLADVETTEGANSGRMLRSLKHRLSAPKKPTGHRGPKVTRKNSQVIAGDSSQLS